MYSYSKAKSGCTGVWVVCVQLNPHACTPLVMPLNGIIANMYNIYVYVHVASCSADKTVRIWKVYHPGNQAGTCINICIMGLCKQYNFIIATIILFRYNNIIRFSTQKLCSSLESPNFWRQIFHCTHILHLFACDYLSKN